MWTDRWTKNGQTKGRNSTNFERNLAIMNSIGQTIFELESGNENVDRQTDGQINGQKTHKRNYTNFERNLAMIMIYLPVKFEFDWTNRF